ncbi:MAG: hypothetical protein Q9170_000220 [Blastenia crenularia]
MATTHTLSRRKPATYGKASCKPLYQQINSSALDPSPPNGEVPVLQRGTILPKPQRVNDFASAHKRRNPSKGIDSELKLKRFPAGSNTSRGPKDDSSFESTVRDTSTWDIAPSDDAETDAHSDPSRGRKKRKITVSRQSGTADKKVSQYIWLTGNNGSKPPTATSIDRANLTGHFPHRPSSSQALIHSSQRTLLHGSVVDPSRSSKASETQAQNLYDTRNSERSDGREKPESSQSMLQDLTKWSGLGSSSDVVKGRSRAEKGSIVASSAPRHLEGADGPFSPVPRTPTRARNSVEASTPHQRELWDMLLPEAYQDFSPVRTDRLGTDASSLDHSRNVVGPAELYEKDTQKSRKSNRRHRLIDKLEPAKKKVQSSSQSTYDRVMNSSSEHGAAPLSDDLVSSSIEDCSQSSGAEHSNFFAQTDTLSSSAGQHRVLPEGGLRVTYSSQRSHLANEGLDNNNRAFDMPLYSDHIASDDAFRNKRERYRAPVVDAAAVESPERVEFDGSQNSSMRSIHELRESGEKVRLMNDLETLFDDMDGPGLIPISLKRSKLCELIRRLQEPAYCRTLLDQGYDRRLLAMSASKENDAVVHALHASTILHLVTVSSGSQYISQTSASHVAEIFAARLKDDQDLVSIAQSRKSNISKRGQADLADCVEILLRSNVWRNGAPTSISGRMIGLQGLDNLVRRRRESGCKTKMLSSRIAERLIEPWFLDPEASPLHQHAQQMLQTQLTVSILESCTIVGPDHDDSPWSAITLAPILAVLAWLNHMPLSESVATRRLVLRLCLNLTNNKPQLCQEFAKPDVIRSILDVVESHFRILSDPQQQGSGRKAVAEVYSEEETSSNVAFGYLSVLVAYLSMEEPARVIVAKRLDDGNLQLLRDAVEEFLQYHRQVDKIPDVDEGEMDVKTNFIGRLETVLARLGDSTRGSERNV